MRSEGAKQFVDQLFVSALERTGVDRDRFLESECARLGLGDEIRSEVKQLLEADEKARQVQFLEHSAPISLGQLSLLHSHAQMSHLKPQVLESCDARSDATAKVVAGSESESLPRSATHGPSPSTYAKGRYVVNRLLGSGSQKHVYLAHDTYLERKVVISILRADALSQPQLRQLRREANVLAHLGDHPHIVTVHDLGDEDGNPFIVCQYLANGSLRALLDKQELRQLPVTSALRIARETCLALSHAHEHGIVHRDVKPENIWLMDDGSIKLGDFGVAISFDHASRSRQAVVAGTPAYMAPEQALGSELGPATDLYALGVMLYELVTGQRPFLGGDWMTLVSQHLNMAPVAPSRHRKGVSAALDRLILRLLEKRPSDRYSDARAVAEAISVIAAGTSAATDLGRDNSLAGLAQGVFVGRGEEIKALRSKLDDAFASRGQVTLLVGEPGSGKSRTADELATFARLRHMHIFRGRCIEGESAPAFWPWVQVLRECVRLPYVRQCLKEIGDGIADVVKLDVEISNSLPRLPEPPAMDPQHSRYRLFDAVTSLICKLALNTPVLLLLDDLQWADESSLRLLTFFAKEIGESPVFVLATARDAQLSRGHPLTQVMGDLVREARIDQLSLTGLSQQHVREYIELTSGTTPPDTLVEQIWRRTKGNAFFVSELIRLLSVENRLDDADLLATREFTIPLSIRNVISRRLAQLSSPCNEVLSIASVLGRKFDREVIRRLVKMDQDLLCDVLDEAVAAKILDVVRGAGGSYEFTHDLIRETIYGQVSTAGKLRCHRQAAQVLEELYQDDLLPKYAELAHHYFQSAHDEGVEKAAAFAEAAARRSSILLAHEDASSHFQLAIQALESKRFRDHERIGRLLIELGETQRRMGRIDLSKTSFRSAIRAAEQTQSAELIAEAAIGLEVSLWQANDVVLEVIPICGKALAMLHEQHGALRARLLMATARALYHVGSSSRATELTQEAIAVARGATDPYCLAKVLALANHVYRGPGNTEKRLAIAGELLVLAKANENDEQIVEAHIWQIIDAAELGDIRRAAAALRELEDTVLRIRHPYYAYTTTIFRTMLAILEGRFDEARQSAMSALGLGRRVTADVVEGSFGIQMFCIARETGELPAVASVLQRIVEERAPSAIWQPGLAITYAALEMRDRATDIFERLAAADFRDLPEDALYAASLAYLAETSVYLHDRRRSALLYDLLLPYAQRTIVASGAVVCLGAAGRFLGQLAACRQQWPEAEMHFQQAITLNSEMGAMTWVARTKAAYAQMLIDRGCGANREVARRLFGESMRIAEALSMKGLQDQLAIQVNALVHGG